MPQLPQNGAAAAMHHAAQAAGAILEHQLGGALITAGIFGLRIPGAFVMESDRYRVTLEERAIVPANAGELPAAPIVHG